LHQASQELHIGDAILDALERGDYTTLGAPIFVRGHLRNYARLLGLGEDEVLTRYEEEGDKPAPPPLVTQKTDSGAPKATTWVFSLLVIVVLCALTVTWWMHRVQPVAGNAITTDAAKSVVTAPSLPVPSTVSAPPAAQAAGAVGVASETPVGPRSESAARQPVAPPPRVSKPIELPRRSTASSASIAPAPKPATAAAANVGTPTHVEFTLNQASWIEVYDVNGKRLYYDLAPAGEHVNVSGAGPLQVFLGNAPGVSIQLNGSRFDQTPFTRSDNTARFRLGGSKDATGQPN
jgi:cytoskeleton protein RodZ